LLVEVESLLNVYGTGYYIQGIFFVYCRR